MAPSTGTTPLSAKHEDNEDLEPVTLPVLPLIQQQRLQELNHYGGERELTTAETAEQEALLQVYYQVMIRRAYALARLKQQGRLKKQIFSLHR